MITNMAYDRMKEYIDTIFQVYIMVINMSHNNKNSIKHNAKLKCISLVIYNYVMQLAIDTGVDLSKINIANCVEPAKIDINLVYFFEYIAHNNIELYDFNKIDESDVDISKHADIERFVLSHIYYLTQ